MDWQFQHPNFFAALLALPLAGFLCWQVLRWKSSAIRKVGDPLLVKQLIGNYSQRNFFLRFILVVTGLAAIILAAVNPMRSGKMDKVDRKGVDVMIALDVSNSMLAEDVAPNRLEKAKQLVSRLIDQLPDDRIGLVIFAGRAYMQMPLTTDHAAAHMYVQNASPDMVPTQGTMISEALRLSAAAFNSKERKFKSIVLITDGEDHDPGSVKMAEELAANGVIVNTVGIGSVNGTPIPDPSTGEYHKDEAGNTVLTKLNEEQLRQLAAATNGVYLIPDDVDDAVGAILKKLATIPESSVEDAAFKDYIHYFPWFAAAALVLLIVELLVPERKLSLA